MGGGGQSQPTYQKLELDPGIASQLQEAQKQYQAYIQQAQAQRPQINTQFGAAPTLKAIPQYQASQQLNPFYQSMVSQGQQGLQQQAAARAAQAIQASKGSPAGQIVAQQLAGQAALQSNPLAWQAAQQQQGTEMQQSQLAAQLAQMANAAQLAQSQEASRLQQIGNEAITQQYGLNLMPAQMQQGLLSTLASLAGLTGTQKAWGGQDERPMWQKINDPLNIFGKQPFGDIKWL